MIHRLGFICIATVLIGGTAASAQELRGTVQRIDPQRGELSVQARGKGLRGFPILVAVDRETQVQIGRQPGAVADLKPGDRVRILYESRDGRRVALAIAARAGPRNGAVPAADPDMVAGALRHVSVADREITVASPGPRGEDATATIRVPSGVPITRDDDKALRLEDLREGQPVAVHTEHRDGRLVATSIHVGAPSDRGERIERIRNFLRMADFFLQQAEPRNEPPRP